jgi:ABC-type Mn2+/Zn2+ transport system permease subunit
MHTEEIAVLIPIVAVLSVFTMLIFWRKFQNDERMAMIEKGMTPIDLDSNPSQKPSFKVSPSITLRLGSLAMGAGLGLLIANILERYTGLDDVVYPAMLLIGGGLGLLIAYFFQLNLDKKNQKED